MLYCTDIPSWLSLSEKATGLYSYLSDAVHVIAGKPNSSHDSADGVEDGKDTSEVALGVRGSSLYLVWFPDPSACV